MCQLMKKFVFVDVPSSKECDGFISEIKTSIILCSMQDFALRFIDSRDIWPFPIVQDALCVD